MAANDLSSEQVRMLQRALTEKGYAVEPSGSMDDQTSSAISSFQATSGLPRTGQLNSDTANALGLDPAEVMPVRGETARAARPASEVPAGYSSTGPAGLSDEETSPTSPQNSHLYDSGGN